MKSFVEQQMVGCGEAGHQDGHFSSAKFTNPQGVVYLHPNSIFVADTGNHLIRKVEYFHLIHYYSSFICYRSTLGPINVKHHNYL